MKDEKEMIIKTEADKPAPRKTGRGGKENFPNARRQPKTPEEKKIVQQYLRETLAAYKQPRVKSDEELAGRLASYFDMCAQTGQIPTVEEMALTTGYSINTVWDWENGRNKGFSSDTSHIIKKAKDFLKSFDGKMAVSGKMNFLAYCFRAKNYYGMVDKQEHVLTPNNPLEVNTTPEEVERLIEGQIPDDE